VGVFRDKNGRKYGRNFSQSKVLYQSDAATPIHVRVSENVLVRSDAGISLPTIRLLREDVEVNFSATEIRLLKKKIAVI
jgi:hypothetical protein